MSKTFKHIHSSSRFDRSVEGLIKAAKKYNSDASIVTYTEVQYEPREKAVRVAGGDGWGLVAGDKSPHNDGVIAYDKAVWTKVYSESFKATDLTYFKVGGGRTQPAYATIAVLEHKETKKRVAILVVHLPSNVESDVSNKKKTPRTLSWFSSFGGTRKRLNTVAKAEHADALMYIADYNLDFKKAWVRTLIKTLAPRFTSTWTNLKFDGGTHGKRVIDATLLKGKIEVEGSARLYSDDASSDHRPYAETLRLL